MKKYILILTVLLFANSLIYSQLPVSALLPVAENLRQHANSIKREEDIIFEIKAHDKAYYKVHKLVTVLNESAKDELQFDSYADKFHSLEEATIILYDSYGKVIKKYNKKDLIFYSYGEELVSDGKYYFLNIPASNYPVHVQIDYEIKFNGLLSYPAYRVQSINQSVIKSTFTVSVPASLDIRYKERGFQIAPAITNEDSKKIYKWTANEMKALKYEDGSVSYESYFPGIILAPNKFELDGYDGDMTSWEKFGFWYGSLSKEAINLSSERKAYFREMVKNASDDREKASIIYKYLQQNCRYVLITLGIGGFKPFEASFVDKKKYGDCKALSNYTQACLDAVGIKSYQALINAAYNKEPVDPSFPANSFNHVILCVPLAKDSVWLECTSNTNEFGVLGSSTENRNALLITGDGGKLVATPRSIAANNQFKTNCTITLREDGSGNVKVNLLTKGEYNNPFLMSEKKDEQKDYLVNTLGFLQPDDFLFTEDKTGNASTQVEMEIDKIPAFTAGNKLFLNPRIYKIWKSVLPNTEIRTQDYYFNSPFIKTDTTIYNLPAGYSLEALPETKELEFAYGNFTARYAYDQKKNQMITTARLELKQHKIPSADYKKTKIFFDEVLSEFNTKIVIRKNE